MTVNHDVTGSRPVGGVCIISIKRNVIKMKLKDFNFHNQETHIYFYVPKGLVSDLPNMSIQNCAQFFKKEMKIIITLT